MMLTEASVGATTQQKPVITCDAATYRPVFSDTAGQRGLAHWRWSGPRKRPGAETRSMQRAFGSSQQRSSSLGLYQAAPETYPLQARKQIVWTRRKHIPPPVHPLRQR